MPPLGQAFCCDFPAGRQTMKRIHHLRLPAATAVAVAITVFAAACRPTDEQHPPKPDTEATAAEPADVIPRDQEAAKPDEAREPHGPSPDRSQPSQPVGPEKDVHNAPMGSKPGRDAEQPAPDELAADLEGIAEKEFPDVTKPRPKPQLEAVEEQEPEIPQEEKDAIAALGPPLVEDPRNLVRLHPVYPVWIDKVRKEVVILGEVCQQNVPLELFACVNRIKDHESVVTVFTDAHVVHAALMALGAKPGSPVRFDPRYVPATGPRIEVTVVWKDKDGAQRRVRAQDWVRDIKTQKAMDHEWIFAGSSFFRDEHTGREYYQANGGDFICVSNFPSAMLDLPVQSTDSNEAWLFECFAERIPPRGTPITLILKPKLQDKSN